MQTQTVKLNNGVEMPVLGLGTYKATDPGECRQAVIDALELGYRLIDTAQIYHNEEYVGEAIAASGVPRDEIFITTKVWPDRFGDARSSVEESMRKLRTDYLDLVLLHWPYGDTYAAYRALEEMYEEGTVRAIGVSNYNSDRLIDLVHFNKVVPAVNQVGTNLTEQRVADHVWMERLGVCHQGYMPFGQGRMDEIFGDPALLGIASKYGKTPRQVTLRFQIQSGVCVIPKSVHRDRIKSNMEVFDFSLTEEEMSVLRGFDRHHPLTGDPETPERTIKITGFTL